MQIIKVITEKDIYPDRVTTPESEYIKPRQATRVVLFDQEGLVALGGNDWSNGEGLFYSMIGGGIDEGETIEVALHREALEETGCKIKNIQELGIVEERGIGHYETNKQIQINHCFIADVDGEKGEPQYTEKDILDKLQLVWLPLDEAIERLRNQEDDFMTRKTLFLLEEAKKLKVF